MQCECKIDSAMPYDTQSVQCYITIYVVIDLTDDSEVDARVSGGRVQEVDPTPVQSLVGPLYASHPQVGRTGVWLELDPITVQAWVFPVLTAERISSADVVPEIKQLYG